MKIVLERENLTQGAQAERHNHFCFVGADITLEEDGEVGEQTVRDLERKGRRRSKTRSTVSG